MDHTIARYNQGVQLEYPNITDTIPVDQTQAELNAIKTEFGKLRLAYMQMMGQQLDSLSYKELQNLEKQLNEGASAVKYKKEQILMDQLKQSKLQEQKLMMENEKLSKQVMELQQGSSQFTAFNPLVNQLSVQVASNPIRNNSTSAATDLYGYPETSLNLGLSLENSYKRKEVIKTESSTGNDSASGSQLVSE
ncbi:hypothetical protein ACFE04_029896 [Oxalis oulophora]